MKPSTLDPNPSKLNPSPLPTHQLERRDVHEHTERPPQRTRALWPELVKPRLGFWVGGRGFGVQGGGWRVEGGGFRVQASGFGVQASGFRVQGSGFRVQGLEFRVQGFNPNSSVERCPIETSAPASAPAPSGPMDWYSSSSVSLVVAARSRSLTSSLCGKTHPHSVVSYRRPSLST